MGIGSKLRDLEGITALVHQKGIAAGVEFPGVGVVIKTCYKNFEFLETSRNESLATADSGARAINIGECVFVVTQRNAASGVVKAFAALNQGNSVTTNGCELVG